MSLDSGHRNRRDGASGGGLVDFIVLGGILGAVMVVAGTVLRDLLPRRLRVPGDDTPWVAVRDQRRTVRSALVAGRLLTISGIVVLLATVVLVFLQIADMVGFTIVVGLTVLGVVACAGWLLWYRFQESTGAIQRRQLQLIATRLGSPRRVKAPADQPPAREEKVAPRSGARPAPEANQRSRAHDVSRPADRGQIRSRPEAPRDSRHPSRRDYGQHGSSRRAERDPALREPGHTDHRPTAPRNDRLTPRPPTRDRLRQTVQQGEGSEYVRQEAPTRSRISESRPTAAPPRSRPGE